MKNLSDELLIEKARTGNEVALDILMNRYKHLASKIARSYFLVGAENEDLLQEAMIGLYKAYLSYDKTKGASFSTLANLCITRNVQTAVKTYNTKKNQVLSQSISLSSSGSIKVHNEDNDEDIHIVIPSSALAPDEKLIESEKIKVIKEQIKNSLSKKELSVLLYFLKGLSYIQIANKLNMTTKAVDNALARVRGKLSFLKSEDN